MKRHIPEKCKACHFIEINNYAHIHLLIFSPNGKRKDERLIFDTGNPYPLMLLSEPLYNALSSFCRIPQKYATILLPNTIRIRGISQKPVEGQKGGWKISFSLPGFDEKYGIIRTIPATTFKGSKHSIISLNAFKKKYVTKKKIDKEDFLEISFLPNQGVGYFCREIRNTDCIMNEKV